MLRETGAPHKANEVRNLHWLCRGFAGFEIITYVAARLVLAMAREDLRHHLGSSTETTMSSEVILLNKKAALVASHPMYAHVDLLPGPAKDAS
ncbi:hypothetical protein N7512_002648 [Penicillium capsulatum]|nr:hypothetical protein N7512_002648 [Penicillium capsulatum]